MFVRSIRPATNITTDIARFGFRISDNVSLMIIILGNDGIKYNNEFNFSKLTPEVIVSAFIVAISKIIDQILAK